MAKRRPSVKAIVYDGIRIELEDYSKEVAKDLKKAQRKGITKAGTTLVKEVKANTPKRTGLLKASINKQIKTGNQGVPMLKIGVMKNSRGKFKGGFASHAHLIEFGTGMRWNKKQKHSTGSVSAYKYLKGTIDNKKDFVRKYVSEEISKIL